MIGGLGFLGAIVLAGIGGAAIAAAVYGIVAYGLHSRDKKHQLHREEIQIRIEQEMQANRRANNIEGATGLPTPSIGCAMQACSGKCGKCGGVRKAHRIYDSDSSVSNGSTLVLDVNPSKIRLRAKGQTKDIWTRH